ncbi:MAG: bifunctional glutamate N-acetyltransferase/amino-acid acetyltransferase ArgJ [Planctomycetota bacterium]
MPKVVGSPPSITAPRGFRASGVACGIKESGKPDLALIVADHVCTAAGVFTTSRFPGEPVKVTREHLAKTGGRAQAIVCNSGISNVATGREGYATALAMCAEVASYVGCATEAVLVASTGVIGEPLPLDKVIHGIGAAYAALGRGPEADEACARAIMTTDTVPKHAFEQTGDGVRVGGIAKGAGMIAPNMATMLGFLTTDASASPDALREAVGVSAATTFNRLSIDSDTSTSDMVLCLASSESDRAKAPQLGEGLLAVSHGLCDQLAWDGEGVTRLIRVLIMGAADEDEAGRVARSVIDSPLVKCAVHGADPNWGRLIMAIGKAGVPLDPARVSVSIGVAGVVVPLIEGGQPCELDASQRKALEVSMSGDQVYINIGLGRGSWEGMWTGVDLSREYVTINADYTT